MLWLFPFQRWGNRLKENIVPKGSGARVQLCLANCIDYVLILPSHQFATHASKQMRTWKFRQISKCFQVSLNYIAWSLCCLREQVLSNLYLFSIILLFTPSSHNDLRSYFSLLQNSLHYFTELLLYHDSMHFGKTTYDVMIMGYFLNYGRLE